MTSYGIGRLIPPRNVNARAIEWLRRYGAAATALAWLPVLGDALCVAAGWLRMHWAAVLAFMAAGRLARIVVASLEKRKSLSSAQGRPVFFSRTCCISAASTRS